MSVPIKISGIKSPESGHFKLGHASDVRQFMRDLMHASLLLALTCMLYDGSVHGWQVYQAVSMSETSTSKPILVTARTRFTFSRPCI